MFEKMSEEEIEEQEENYNLVNNNQQSLGSKKYLYLGKKHTHLHRTTGIISGKLGKIKDVLQFLENLQYSNSI